jgi:hypothetical protein
VEQLGCLARVITIKRTNFYSALQKSPEAFNGGVPS